MLKLLLLSLVLLAGFTSSAMSQETHPCALITPEEAAAALGAPLAVPPFASNGVEPSADGSLCRIEDADFRTIDVRVAWRDGGEEFAAMNIVGSVLSDSTLKDILSVSEGATEIGEWDEARIIGCCEFVALRGETLVDVAFGGAAGGLAGAVELANAALRRLEAPQAFDTAAGVAAAQEREALRPEVRNACELVSAEKAAEITGAPLSADPIGESNNCTWSWEVPGEGYVMEMKMAVSWRGGFAEHLAVLDAIGIAGGFMQGQGLDIDDATTDAFADAQSSSFIAEMAVEDDVLVSIESGGFMADIARGLIAAAVETIRAR